MTKENEFIDYLQELGQKWQKKWEKAKIYESDPDPKREKFFVTFPYPYVNGSVHLGHGYTVSKMDFIARFKRMQGYNVLFPQGFHATGEPIVGQAKRLKKGDEKVIKALKKFGVKDEDIPKFYDPVYMAKYFINLMRKDLKSIGLAIDWRREFVTTDMTPTYSKFITWQYLRLREKGYITQGTHPVIWCPSCKSPTGDHDRLEGEGVSISEWHTLIFGPDESGYYYPCATLRPETVLGVTNVFVHPNIEYVIVEWKGKDLLLTQEAIKKLKDQLFEFKEKGKIKGKELIGRKVRAPLVETEVPVLPGTFVKADYGTGVVMSVPGHAPFDWAALKYLREHADEFDNPDLIRKLVDSIKPVALIDTKGLPEMPGVTMVDKEGVTLEDNEALEKLTKEIYKKELHQGRVKKGLPFVGGKPVKDAREEIARLAEEQAKGFVMYEPEDRVVCRCGTQCHVKILENQWFLRYSDEEWKQKVREHLKKMRFYPETIRKLFEDTIEWLQDKACARKTGLGTKLPWDPEWIVETLSDSTIYMAYYTLHKYVKQGILKEEHCTPEFFDYVFWSKGDLDSLSKQIGLSKEKIQEMHDEFHYWYPVDMRGSGRDLVQNHLTFFLFHHVALFPDKSPRAIEVNGQMTHEGQKMSKSKGIFTPLSEAVALFSPDLVRVGLLGAGQGLDDANFREKDLQAHNSRLQKVKSLVENINSFDKEETEMDKWMRSRLQKIIMRAREAGENIETRSYVQAILYDLLNDLRWYERRRGALGPATVDVTKALVLLLTPITPHFTEEMWRKLGHDSFVVNEKFPEPNQELIDEEVETNEKFAVQLYEDVLKIAKVLAGKETGNKMIITLAPNWMYEVAEIVKKDKKKAISKVAKDPRFKDFTKDAVKVAQTITKQLNSGTIILSKDKELETIKSLSRLLEETIEKKVIIEEFENATSPKANVAIPGKPAVAFA